MTLVAQPGAPNRLGAEKKSSTKGEFLRKGGPWIKRGMKKNNLINRGGQIWS
jgi:hypothetical protein